MMTDDKLNNILSGFRPAVGPADDFMARLERNLDIADTARAQARREIEAVERRQRQWRRESRRAVLVASLVGFVVGVAAALVFNPLWRAMSAGWSLSVAENAVAQAAIWLAVATVAGFCAVNSYTLMRLLAQKRLS